MKAMNKQFATSFDDLIQNHYGGSGSNRMGNVKRVEELFANYYGKEKVRRKRTTNKPPAIVLSLSYDDGETLPQHPRRKGGDEHVGQESISHAEFKEYVVTGSLLSRESSIEMEAAILPASEADVFQEYRVDVLQPLKQSSDPVSRTDANVPSPEAPVPAGTAEQPPRPAAATPAPLPMEEASRAKATEDDFVADLQSILTGQKVFDPLSKRTVEKDKLGQSKSLSSQTESSGQPAPEFKNEHAIFDRIAQSMQYANQYDMGTLELKNRFSDFDKISELQQKAAADKKSMAGQKPAAGTSPVAKVDSADFLQDLDSIQKQRSEVGIPSVVPTETSPRAVGETSASGTSAPAATTPPAGAAPIQPIQPSAV